MAVVEVNEWFERGETNDARAIRERWKTLLVRVDDPTDPEETVLAHEDVWQIGEALDANNPDLLCSWRNATYYRAGESLYYWLVECRFANNLNFGAGDKWRWLTGFNAKIANKGYFFSGDGEGGGAWSNVKIPYLTSALGRVSNPPEFDEPYQILQIQRGALLAAYFNVQGIIEAALMGTDGQGTVNQNSFIYQTRIFLPGEVRLVDVSAEEATADNSAIKYANVVYTFWCRRGGWYDDIFDEDVAQLVQETRTIDGQQVTIFRRAPILKAQPGAGGGGILGGAPAQEPVTDPVPLDGNGRELIVETGGGDVANVANIPFAFLRYRKFDPFPYELIGF